MNVALINGFSLSGQYLDHLSLCALRALRETIHFALIRICRAFRATKNTPFFYSNPKTHHSKLFSLLFPNRLFPTGLQIIFWHKIQFSLNEAAVKGNIFGVFVNRLSCDLRFYANNTGPFFN
jgi:hypothetical protein